jgi:hypothetical protein
MKRPPKSLTQPALSTTELDILGRILDPEQIILSTDAARSLLALRFSDPDKERMKDLAEKVRA